MIWAILVVLLVLWLIGFTVNIGGALTNLLLVAAAVVLVVKLVTGRNVT